MVERSKRHDGEPFGCFGEMSRLRPIKYITNRRRAIPILLFALCVVFIGGSFIRMWSDPDFRRSDLPLSTVEDTLSKSLQRDTEIAQVQLQQCKIVYEVGGDGEDVVLLHCWAGSKEYWKWTVQALIPHFRVYALDLKGFGDSDKPKDGYTMEDYSRLVAEFLDALRSMVAGSQKRICFISGVDLSHMGPQFGDSNPVDQFSRSDVEEEDLAILRKLEGFDAEGFFRLLEKDGNGRRICGFPAIYVHLRTMEASRAEILKYDQGPTPDGQSVVSFAAMAFYG